MVKAALGHDLLQLVGHGFAQQLPLAGACHGDDGVPVGNGGGEVGAAAQRVAELGGEVLQPSDEGVLLEDDLPLPGGVDLQRVALADAHGAADFLGDDNAAQIVPLCQVGAKKFYKLSEKPLISMALGFSDGATMHLRGFDRLCYFRSKFDRFATK